jgi:hypothetical protein
MLIDDESFDAERKWNHGREEPGHCLMLKEIFRKVGDEPS